MSDKLKTPFFKTRFFALTASIATLLGAPAHAQDLPAGWDPRSGDGWVDAWLGDISRYGSRYREPFVDEMVRYYGAPRELVGDLLDRRRWTPGDVYYACALAQVLGRPCRYVVDEWDRDPAEGWGAVAQRLGVKPGSAEFHKLKRGFVPTYDRWGRPIVIDGELRRDFPNRPYREYATAAKGSGKGAKEKSGKAKANEKKPGPGRGGKDSAKPAKGQGKGSTKD
ncbi:hypothetical protein [Lysobacter sp. CA199]|uniref:hypothetical protein n=1 Tax=Lysobacter sp. CA199 TaxID=3455608 RepID=UPI003F8D60F5